MSVIQFMNLIKCAFLDISQWQNTDVNFFFVKRPDRVWNDPRHP